MLFRFGVHAPPPPAAQVDAARARCAAPAPTPNALAVGAEGLRYGGRPADAVALAAAATRSEPRTFVTWVAYGDALLAAGRPVPGGLAYERARPAQPALAAAGASGDDARRRLGPRGSLKRSSGRSTR